MLQFIVLGYVPGTSIQLNFIDYMLVVLLGMLVVACFYFYSIRVTRRLTQQLMLSLIAL